MTFVKVLPCLCLPLSALCGMAHNDRRDLEGIIDNEVVYSAKVHITKMKSIDSMPELTVGDKVPSIVFDRVLNSQLTAGKLSDFAGKFIVLDFWATWCVPCVNDLPRMQELQDRHRDNLQIITISDEDEKILNGFIGRRKDFRLPVAIKTGEMRKLFPHLIIPHSIVIDQNGIIQAITSSKNVNEKLITDLVAGKKINLPVKKDIMEKISAETISLVNKTDRVMFRSQVTRNIPGAGGSAGPILSGDSVIGGYAVNTTLAMLYLLTVKHPDYFKNRLWLGEGLDSSLFFQPRNSQAADVDAWANDHAYCYELIAPQKTAEEKRKLILQTLRETFSWLHDSLEYRENDCFVLTATHPKKLKKSLFKSFNTGGSNNATASVTYLGATMNDFAKSLEYIIDIPVIDETGVQGRYDVDLSIALLNNKKRYDGIKDLNDALHPLGLMITKQKRRMQGLAFYRQ